MKTLGLQDEKSGIDHRDIALNEHIVKVKKYVSYFMFEQ